MPDEAVRGKGSPSRSWCTACEITLLPCGQTRSNVRWHAPPCTQCGSAPSPAHNRPAKHTTNPTQPNPTPWLPSQQQAALCLLHPLAKGPPAPAAAAVPSTKSLPSFMLCCCCCCCCRCTCCPLQPSAGMNPQNPASPRFVDHLTHMQSLSISLSLERAQAGPCTHSRSRRLP